MDKSKEDVERPGRKDIFELSEKFEASGMSLGVFSEKAKLNIVDYYALQRKSGLAPKKKRKK